MRYSDRITFVTETEGGFNPDTGNHEEPSLVEDIKACNISPLGIERTVNLFGELDVVITVARLQRPYKQKFDYVEVNGNRLNVKRHVAHRMQSVFYLEGAL